MANSSLLINQGTNSLVNFDSNGGTFTQVIAPGYGTISTIGTLPNLPGGTLNAATVILNNGTINLATVTGNLGVIGTVGLATVSGNVGVSSGTLNAATAILNSGTINVGTFVGNGGSMISYGPAAAAAAAAGNPLNTGGTDSGGTIRTILVNAAGAQNVGTLNNGTVVMPSGTVTTGSLANVAMVNAGTVVIPSGTLTTGSLSNLALLNAGTISMINAGTIGTVTNLGQLYNAGTVQNQLAGTITALQNGTITNGSIIITAGSLVGTQQVNPLPAVNTISHAGTSGTTAIGTLVTAATFGAGTAGYIASFHLMALSGTLEMVLAFGSVINGNQVIAHGLFPAGGGIAKDISYPHGYGTTNSPITYQILSGSGTASWDVNYFPHT